MTDRKQLTGRPHEVHANRHAIDCRGVHSVSALFKSSPCRIWKKVNHWTADPELRPLAASILIYPLDNDVRRRGEGQAVNQIRKVFRCEIENKAELENTWGHLPVQPTLSGRYHREPSARNNGRIMAFSPLFVARAVPTKYFRFRNTSFATCNSHAFHGKRSTVPIDYPENRSLGVDCKHVDLESCRPVAKQECCLLPLFFQLMKYKIRRSSGSHKASPSSSRGQPVLKRAAVGLAKLPVTNSGQKYCEKQNRGQRQKCKYWNKELFAHRLPPSDYSQKRIASLAAAFNLEGA